MRHHFLVRCPVILELVSARGAPLPAQGELRFAGSDPYAVALALQTLHSREVVWRFSRALLAQGLIEAAGEGDVRLRPLDTQAPGGIVEIELRSPGGGVVFRASHPDLRRYLTRTQEFIAFGAEHEWLDLDHTIAMLRLAPPRSGTAARVSGSERDGRSPSSRRDRGGPSGPSPTQGS
jgi:Streptomyces sporulation and cell division protein, SsgA